ncbi:MAG: HDOD domain-containing protein [Rhodocyclales bacterium]|nr:HDOD domain-containing protein [Rhodocyclales bacterium]
MMTTAAVTQQEVIDRSSTLPAFPLVVSRILATLDDPEANTATLADYIRHDPAITARILSLANTAATQTRRLSPVHDIFTATSLLGLGRVRQLATVGGISGYVAAIAPADMPLTFWQHSVAVGVCSEELALHTSTAASASAALIAGLLHDIGQLWLHRFHGEAFRAAWSHALGHSIGIEQVERERFGVDHATIGAWLAGHWSLPADIVAAIHHHHAPDTALDQALVPVVHVAEVLSNALDLASRDENRVTSISAAACARLGLGWDESARPLFGRMEARSRHANAFFLQTP